MLSVERLSSLFICYVCAVSVLWFSTMAEQSSSASTSESSSDEYVKIPKSIYLNVVAHMRQQNRRLVAASNLQRLIHNKDRQLAASREENEQLQLVLQQNEARLSSMIQLQATAAAAAAATSLSATTHALEADNAYPRFDTSPLCGDVDPDGEMATVPPCFPLPSNEPKVTFERVTHTSIPASSVPVASSSTKVFSPSTDVTCLATSTVTHMSPVASLAAATNAESKDLLDKVIRQNARLKKTLRDLLSQKGLSVSTFLVCFPDVNNYILAYNSDTCETE